MRRLSSARRRPIVLATAVRTRRTYVLIFAIVGLITVATAAITFRTADLERRLRSLDAVAQRYSEEIRQLRAESSAQAIKITILASRLSEAPAVLVAPPTSSPSPLPTSKEIYGQAAEPPSAQSELPTVLRPH
jgi:hypothetical protein